MADLADKAKELEEAERAALLAARRPPPGTGRRWCIDCGEEIPAARRRTLPAATRCAFCQGGHEELLKAGIRRGGA